MQLWNREKKFIDENKLNLLDSSSPSPNAYSISKPQIKINLKCTFGLKKELIKTLIHRHHFNPDPTILLTHHGSHP